MFGPQPPWCSFLKKLHCSCNKLQPILYSNRFIWSSTLYHQTLMISRWSYVFYYYSSLSSVALICKGWMRMALRMVCKQQTVLPQGFGDGFSVYLRTVRCGVVRFITAGAWVWNTTAPSSVGVHITRCQKKSQIMQIWAWKKVTGSIVLLQHFAAMSCEVKLNTLQGGVITLDIPITATVRELKVMLLTKHPCRDPIERNILKVELLRDS